MSTAAAAGPGSGGCHGSTRAPVALPARSYDADRGPAGPAGPPEGVGARSGPCCCSGRAADRLQGPSTSGGPDVLEHRGRGRAVVRKNSVVAVCRSATIFARTIDPYEISALRSLRAFSAAAPIGGAGGGLPGVGAAFLRTPLRAGALFCNTPLSGVHYPPLGGGVPPRGGVSALFWGHIGTWTTNGQPMDNQQTTKKHDRKPAATLPR